jgi:hypothetical protein
MNDVEFIVGGSPRHVARAIESHVDHHRAVSALVVPWESDDATVSMAVTLAKGEGWAIEHTNLGTIRLTDIGNDRTRVTAVTVDESGDPEGEELARVFSDFARQIKSRFQGTS